MAVKANRPEDATCTIGSTLINGREVRIAPDTTGVLHILQDVRNERIRLKFVKNNEESNRLTGMARWIVSMRECAACHTAYMEETDEDGTQFLSEHRLGGTLLFDEPAAPEDRPAI